MTRQIANLLPRLGRRPLAAICLLALLAVVSGCEQDVYEKGEGKNSLLRADLAEIHTNTNLQFDHFTTDDGDSLTCEPLTGSRWAVTPDTTYRALIYYNKVKNDRGVEVAELVSAQHLLTLGLQPATQPNLPKHSDPLKLESIWISKSRRYLNLGLILMSGNTEETAVHRLTIVQDSLVSHANGKQTLCVRLIHDQGGIPEYYSQRTFLSMSLRYVRADSVRMTVNTYDGPVTKTLSLSR